MSPDWLSAALGQRFPGIRVVVGDAWTDCVTRLDERAVSHYL